jgi:histidine ammonia-lyase
MIIVGNRRLSVQDFEKVLYQDVPVALDGMGLKKVSESFSFLQSYAQNKIIYGINTGLGPMAQYKISEEDQRQLQLNLIRSHSSGAGKPFDEC